MTETEKRRIRTGWRGRFYEDLQVGDVYRSRFGRTVTLLFWEAASSQDNRSTIAPGAPRLFPGSIKQASNSVCLFTI